MKRTKRKIQPRIMCVKCHGTKRRFNHSGKMRPCEDCNAQGTIPNPRLTPIRNY